MSLFLVVVVYGVNNILLAVFDNFPDSTTDHVAGGQWRDNDSLALTTQTDWLIVFQLKKYIKIAYLNLGNVFSMIQYLAVLSTLICYFSLG